MFSFTPIVKNLLIINVIMFVIPQVFLSAHNQFIEFFGLRYFLSPAFFPTQFLSYALIHASWGHLFSNMFGLLVFGPLLENRLGSRKFLLFYVITAIGAGIIYGIIHFFEVYPFLSEARDFLGHPDPEDFARLLSGHFRMEYEANLVLIDQYARNPGNPLLENSAINLIETLINLRSEAPMVGASGAVFGVILGFGYLFPNLQMMLLFPPIPIRAKYLVGFYAIFALYSAVEKVPGDNVAHYAHLGGMVVGYLLLRYWKIRPGYY
jgi:membrane associated rhomboid family serine protease